MYSLLMVNLQNIITINSSLIVFPFLYIIKLCRKTITDIWNTACYSVDIITLSLAECKIQSFFKSEVIIKLIVWASK